MIATRMEILSGIELAARDETGFKAHAVNIAELLEANESTVSLPADALIDRPDQGYYVVSANRQHAIGFVAVTKAEEDEPLIFNGRNRGGASATSIQLSSFVIEREFQGLGIGSSLLEFCLGRIQAGAIQLPKVYTVISALASPGALGPFARVGMTCGQTYATLVPGVKAATDLYNGPTYSKDPDLKTKMAIERKRIVSKMLTPVLDHFDRQYR